jgi:hypothetical protein
MLNTEKWTTEGDIPRQFGPWTTPRIKGDDSKFLNGGWCHIFDNLKLSSLLT